MPESYPFEDRLNARGCFVVDGMTYEQVSRASGISASQLKRWGSDEGWVEARNKYREAQVSIRENTVLLRAGLLKNALVTKEAQDVYAVAAMEKIAIALDNVRAGRPEKMDVPDMNFADPEEMVDALWKAIEFKAASMIQSPESMDLKQIQSGIETWGKLKQKYAKHTGKPKIKEIDEDAVQVIRDIYGLSK